MTAALATIDTPANVQLSSGVLTLKANGTADWGCQESGVNDGYHGNTDTAQKYIAALADRQTNLFTPSTYMKVSQVKLQIQKNGGPSPNMYVDIRSTLGVNPTATILSSSTAIAMGSIVDQNAVGHIITFTLGTTLEFTAATSYAAVLLPTSGSGLDGANNIGWVTTDSAACTNFPVFLDSADSGGTWQAVDNGGYRRSYFTLVGETHASSGSVSWIVKGFSGAVWSMSSFAFSENPGSITAGTITYDVGVGTSATVSTYSQTGLSKAAVQALANKTGDYFYVRANFSIATPFFENVRLGNGSINAN